MTRGIIVVKDAEQQETLYLPSDAYVGGSMDLAMEYCEANHGKRMSVKEMAFDLLKAIAGTEVYTHQRNPGLDYVYTVQLNHGECPDDFVYQKVLTNCNYDEPIPSARSDTRFYRADMEEKRRMANEYWAYQNELNDSILPCPHCGKKGWHNITPKGEIAHCFVDVCPGSTVGKWCRTFEEAIAEWNRYVLSVKNG